MIMAERLIAQEVFEFLRPEQVHALSEASEKISCRAGETVYERGAKADHFFTLLKGEVALRLPGKGGVSIVIDQLTKGAMFGSCVCFNRDSYSLTAQCSEDTELLRTKSSVLKSLMDSDPRMGYSLQTRISEIYFNRYNETMKKLQAIVMNIPIEAR
jgi:CRP-like cAMP-binding protein